MKTTLIGLIIFGFSFAFANSFAYEFTPADPHVNESLRLAVHANDERAVLGALKNGADPDVRFSNRKGWVSVLAFTATQNNAVILKMLLKNGANINLGAATRDTPLMLAVAFQAYDAIELLLRYGADATLANSTGVTAFGYAVHLRDEKIIAMLKKHESDK